MSYLKRLTNAALGRLLAFRMYGGIGMSASSLHRESTDSLMHVCVCVCVCVCMHSCMHVCMYMDLLVSTVVLLSELIWRVAHYTSAAPFYCKPKGYYIDGFYLPIIPACMPSQLSRDT